MVEHDVLKRDKDVLQTELLEVNSRLSKRENDIKILKVCKTIVLDICLLIP